VETTAGELKIVHWHDFITAAVLDEPDEETDAHPDRERRLVAAG
jgi:hypothetical protein